MLTSTTDLTEIARSLTKAQREAVKRLTVRMEVPQCIDLSSNAFKSLDDAWGGILVWSEWVRNPVCKAPPHRKAYRLSPLGLAVRAILQEQNNG